MNKLIKLGLCILFLLVSFVSSETIDITDLNHTGQNYLWNDNIGKNESGITTTVTDGLVYYWDMNGDAVDSVGGNDGVTATTSTTGHLGVADTSLYFDGVNNNITPSNQYLFSGMDSFTISLWLKTPTPEKNFQMLIAAEANTYICFLGTTGRLYWRNAFSSDTVLDANRWYHTVFVYYDTTETTELFIDGESDTTGAKMHYLWYGQKYWIGMRGDGLNFNGSMDNFRIYNRSLSTEEIKALYEERNDYHTNGSLSYAFCIDDCINDTGLVGQWKLNGDATDSVGTNDGTTSGVINTTGRYDGAYDFDGSGDYVDVGNDVSILSPEAITMSAWVKKKSNSPSNQQRVFSRQSQIAMYFNGDATPLLYMIGPSDVSVSAISQINLNEWTHLVGTYGDGNMCIYINGELSDCDVSTGNITLGNFENCIGSTGIISSCSGFHFNGSIDNVMLWNRSLSSEEVYKLYLSGYEQHLDNATLNYVSYDGDSDLGCHFFNTTDAPFSAYSTDSYNYSNWTGYYSNLTSLSLTSYSNLMSIDSRADYGICEMPGTYFSYANFRFSGSLKRIVTVPSITDNSGNTFNISDDQGNNVSSAYENTNISIQDSTGKKLVKFEGLFSSGNVDISNINIEYNDNTVVVDLSFVSNIGTTHTMYYPNSGKGFLLCPEAKTLSAARPGCLNATLFTHTDAVNNVSKSIAGAYFVSVTIDGSYYKVSGLRGTAITWAKNVSVVSRVSITESPPSVDSVTLSDSDGGDMDLYPNSTVILNCSGTASDSDGWATLSVNATINSSVAAGSVDSYLTHYSNNSCVTLQNTATQANYYCTFSVWYNANPGIWTCTVTATDGTTAVIDTDVETMGELIAVDVDSGDLDFGALAVGASTTDSSLDNSKNKTISNQGNVIFDVNLKAYGSGIGDNNSMSCDSGNISVSMLRYTFNTTSSAHNWTLMTPVVNGTGTDYNISVPVSSDTSGIPVNPFNYSWWSFKVASEPIVSGDCSGTLMLSAISDS